MSYKFTALLVILLFFVSQAFSQNSVRESFDYTATIDGLGDASNGWGGPWAVDTSAGGTENLAAVANHVFDFEDLNWVLPDTGSQLQVTRVNAWGDAQRYKRPLAETWANEAGKSYWISYMLDVKEPLPIGNTYFMVKLYYNDGELVAIGKGGGRDANAPVFTCGSGWPGNAGDDVSDVEIEAGPVWLVARIDMSGGDGNDRTFMWVDPDPEEVPDTTNADVKRNSSMPDGFNNVAIEFGGDGATQMVFDEITIADSYSGLSVITALPGELNNRVPSRLMLSQNYPNPFNPTTQITYAVENNGQLKLAVYDVSGREVAVLANRYHTIGTYTVAFSGRNLASGIYFYQLSSANGIITRKMTLIK